MVLYVRRVCKYWLDIQGSEGVKDANHITFALVSIKPFEQAKPYRLPAQGM
jgi:hypothetical protein